MGQDPSNELQSAIENVIQDIAIPLGGLDLSHNMHKHIKKLKETIEKKDKFATAQVMFY